MADEKPNAKTTLPESLLQRALGYGDRAMRWLFGLSEGWEKRRDILKNNYELGVKCLKDGHLHDAVFRFKLTTWLDPKFAEGWYGLGAAYFAGGKKKPAEKALRKALELKPDYPEAAKLLAVAMGDSPA